MGTLQIDSRKGLFNSSSIGANELKASMKLNTIKGFLFTNGSMIAILTGLVFSGLLVTTTSQDLNRIFTNGSTTIFNGYKTIEIDVPIDIPEIPTLPAGTNYITNQFAGNPIPIPDIIVNDREFAGIDQIGVSLAAAVGTKIDGASIDTKVILDNNTNNPAVNNSSNSAIDNSIPDEGGFIPLENEPVIEMNELYGNLQYPEVLRKAGVEGRVVVSLLIDEKGRILKTNVKSSTNPYFEKAAIEALTKATCKPGIQNGNAVKSWLMIPIVFKLK